MDDRARRFYRALGTAFVVLAVVFIAVGVAERVFSFTYFSGDVLPLALTIGVIGAALLYTVRDKET